MPWRDNIVLIGMPAVGKSTVGVLLAKQLGLGFLDTDIHIQNQENRRLQSILTREGIDAFCRLEERYLLALDCRRHVIATGGSVVYSDRAMQHLRARGTLVFMDLTPEGLSQRLGDIDSRGVIRAPGQTIEGLYRERRPLYDKYGDFKIDCRGLTPDQTVAAIIGHLPDTGKTRSEDE